MTVALYARRKSWPLEAVTVRLRHSKIHAADCADCETKEGMLDHIESDLEFVGRLTQEQRSKLLEIAEKCPVHRTLVSENRHSHPRAVSNGAHPSDYAARELWTAIPCDSLEDRRVVPTSESPTTRRWPHQSIQARFSVLIRRATHIFRVARSLPVNDRRNISQ